jgi:hypothetical protein
MANYKKILRLRPEIRDFAVHRAWVHRGDVLVYQPSVDCPAFSTDRSGFRHSSFQGKRMSLADCLLHDRYGLVLGASNIYGFGVVGNESALPSLLAERFEFPFANLGMPGGNGRNLHSLLMGIFARARQRPAAIIYFSGGDYSSFCKTSICDSVFGSPSRHQVDEELKERGGNPNAEVQLPALLAFTSLWTTAIVQACRQRKIPVVLGHDTTFFEKAEASELEDESDLGKPTNASQERQFANHRKFGEAFYNRRRNIARKVDVPLAGWGLENEMTFIDEFHADGDGTRLLADAVAETLKPLLEDAASEPSLTATA